VIAFFWVGIGFGFLIVHALNLTVCLKHESVEWVTGDFTNKHDVEEFVAGADVVMHLVSEYLTKRIE
jgi:hypothetical protein